jgi:hypothetical protein
MRRFEYNLDSYFAICVFLCYFSNNFNFSSENEGTNFEGSIDNIGSINGSFEKSANNNVVFKIDVQDTSYNFKLNETYKDGLLEEGKAELKTTNLSYNKIYTHR